MEKTDITIYTDGACTGNPGPGGYGVVILENGKRQELSAGYRLTTNNRMELLAVIVALGSLKQPSKVKLYTDSQYVADSINRDWAKSWRARNWKKADRTKALNVDLWKQALDLLERHEVQVIWVRGHTGNRENERCDLLAVSAANRRDLPPDSGYEQSQAVPNQAGLF